MQNRQIPPRLKKYLWSYDFAKLDIDKDRKTIVVNILNYGQLSDWRWLVKTYGQKEVQKILSRIVATELRTRVIPLITNFFGIKLNHEHRSNS